jgi:hypothetical protein
LSRRIDYHDDPNAPKATSMVPSVNVVVANDADEARQEFSIVLTARPVGGQLTLSDESTEVRWVPSAEAQSYTMDRAMRSRVGHHLERRASPVIT